MRRINSYVTVLFLLILCSCRSQEKETAQKIGGPCEGCEALHEYGDRTLTQTDTLPKFSISEPKLKLTGTVFRNDGKTPADNVIIYIYQTNREGIYERKGDEKGWARRHGHIRGWAKTGKDGQYTFYTFQPGAYPNRRIPAHIHITVKEPGKNEYYLDDFVFDDDPLLTQSERERMRKRGGSGISIPIMRDGILTIERDLILGLNIPDYQ